MTTATTARPGGAARLRAKIDLVLGGAERAGLDSCAIPASATSTPST